MSDLSGLVSIKDIVRETLWFAKRGDAESNYKRFVQYAINGYRELNEHHFKNTKRVKLEMDDNHIIPFPDDMIKAVNIYIPLEGRYVRLTREDTMVDTTSLQAGVIVRDEDDGENEDIKVVVAGFRGGITNEYGYYTEDIRNSRFIFLTDYRTEVILDYISNGISTTDDAIPVMCKDAIQKYLIWQEAFWERTYNLGEKDMYKNEWLDALRMLRNFQAPTLEEMADMMNNYSTQLPIR